MLRLSLPLAAAVAALAAAAPASASYSVGLSDGATTPYFQAGEDFLSWSPAGTTLISEKGSSHFLGATEAGVVVFSTEEPLLPSDGDTKSDIYVRTPMGLQKVTPGDGPDSGINYVGHSTDGTGVFLETDAALLPNDTDQHVDVYAYNTKSESLMLFSPGTDSHDAHVAAVPGPSLFISTDAPLSANDTDTTTDVFGLSFGAVKITEGNGPHPAHLVARGGTTGAIIYSTAEALLPADKDTHADLYRDSGNGPVLLTPTTNAVQQSTPAAFVGAATTDVGRVIFETKEPLVQTDTDTALDLYSRDGGTTSLLTPGTTDDVWVEDVSSDAKVVLFSTTSKVLGSDTDTARDLYKAIPGGLVHVVKTNAPLGQFNGELSPDGAVTAFRTDEPLANTDADTAGDVYVMKNGLVSLASGRAAGVTGGPDGLAALQRVLVSGMAVFSTEERLLAADTDDETDVYGFANGTLTLLSVRPAAVPTTTTTTTTNVSNETPPFFPPNGPTNEQRTEEPLVDRTAPRMTRIALKRLGRGRVALSFRLDENARVRIALQRRGKTVRTVVVTGRKGANRRVVRLAGRPSRLRLIAIDTAGNKSVARFKRVV